MELSFSHNLVLKLLKLSYYAIFHPESQFSLFDGSPLRHFNVLGDRRFQFTWNYESQQKIYEDDWPRDL